jgi:hypothetical protein
MTQGEVVALMGAPDRRASPDRIEGQTWDAYWYVASRIIGRGREVRIDFDPHCVRRIEELPYEQIQFDSESWLQSSEVRRGFMLDDLLDRHDLATMSRKQIVTLLGQPPESYGKRFGDLVWCLGPERGSLYPVDNDWLVIDVDERDQVTRVRVVSD